MLLGFSVSIKRRLADTMSHERLRPLLSSALWRFSAASPDAAGMSSVWECGPYVLNLPVWLLRSNLFTTTALSIADAKETRVI